MNYQRVISNSYGIISLESIEILLEEKLST